MAIEPTLLEFPCQFPIKIVGAMRDGYAEAIIEVVRRHMADFEASHVEMRPSQGGKYLSLTCLVNATSKSQLDGLYRDLSAHPWVNIVL